MKVVNVDELNKLLSGTSVSYDYDNEQLTYLNSETYAYEPVMEALERNGAIMSVPDKSDVHVKSLYKCIDVFASLYSAYAKKADLRPPERLIGDLMDVNVWLIENLKEKGFSEEEITSSVPDVDLGLYFAYLEAEEEKEGEEEYEAQ